MLGVNATTDSVSRFMQSFGAEHWVEKPKPDKSGKPAMLARTIFDN
jgi:hypothetical protein